MFIIGNEGAELAYKGAGGSAYEWKPFEPKDKKDDVALRSETANVNRALTTMNADLERAWDRDYDELRNDYSLVVDNLKKYEQTSNKGQKRALWYDINSQMGALQNKINASRKQRDAYVNEYRRIENDTKGVYNRESFDGGATADEEMELWANQPVLKRGEYPKVNKNSTQSAIAYVLKNVRYKPSLQSEYTKQASGTWKSEKKSKIDPAELKESIKTTVQSMPPNLRQAMMSTPINPGGNETFLSKFLANNPTAAGLPADQRANQFSDWLTDELYGSVESSIKQIDVKAESMYRPSRGSSRKRFGFIGMFGDGIATNEAIFTMDKTDEQGSYRIKASSGQGMKMNPVLEWEVTGAQFKKITGVTNDIDDNAMYAIPGRLASIDVNFEKGLESSVNINYETGDDGAIGYNIQTGQVIKGSKIRKQVPVSLDYNYGQLYKLGTTPEAVYEQLKNKADEEYKKKKSAPVSGGSKQTVAPQGKKKTLPAPPNKK